MSESPHASLPRETADADARRQGLTLRAVVIGLIACAGVSFVVCWAELVVKVIQIAILQFAPAAVGMLLFIVLINLALHRLWRRLALKPQEIAYIYVMTMVTALTVSRGLLERWISGLVGVNYYATPGNHWQELFFKYIPAWAVPWNPAGDVKQPVVRLFYEGLPAGATIPWSAWLRPIGWWLVVIIALMAAYLALASLLRRQWVDNEKLTFPLVQLPVELAREAETGAVFFRNKLTWIGFAIPTFVFMFNGIHGLRPSVPLLPVQYPLNPTFSAMGRPWSDLGYTTAYCSMAAVGFAYFLPTELLLSLWSFFIFVRLENVAFSGFGMTPEAMPLYPTTIWNGYQVAGAYIVLTGYLVKSALPHFREMWQRVYKGEPKDEVPEMMSARTTFLVLGGAVIVAIAWFQAFGMSTAMSIIEVVVFLFVVVLVMARSVSEAGMLETETSFQAVDIVRLVTTQASLGGSNLTALAMADAVFTRDLRGNLVSTYLDGLKMSDLLHYDRRHYLVAAALGLMVALTVGLYLHLWFPYHYGAVNLYSYGYQSNSIWGFQQFQGPMMQPDLYDPRLPVFFLSGVGITLLLSYMRTMHAWWPFYPLGFALSGSWSMIVFWFPLLIAWVLKSVIMKYGGFKVYRNLRPFFLGLILGEFSQAVIWATLAGIWRVPAPFFPWP